MEFPVTLKHSTVYTSPGGLMKSILRTFAFPLICLAFLGVQDAYPQASTEYRRDDLGISLSYPSFFSPLPAPSPQVVLLLRPPNGRYPSFNILVQGGDPQVERKSLEQLKTDVVDSYRGVGLYDAEVRFVERRNAAGRTVLFARVYYKQDGVPLASGVYIVPARDEYYVCTLITAEEAMGRDEPYLHDIVNSLAVKEPPPPPPSNDETKKALFWFGVLLVSLVGAKLVSMLLRR